MNNCPRCSEQKSLDVLRTIVAACDRVTSFLADAPDSEINRVHMKAFVNYIKVQTNIIGDNIER